MQQSLVRSSHKILSYIQTAHAKITWFRVLFLLTLCILILGFPTPFSLLIKITCKSIIQKVIITDFLFEYAARQYLVYVSISIPPLPRSISTFTHVTFSLSVSITYLAFEDLVLGSPYFEYFYTFYSSIPLCLSTNRGAPKRHIIYLYYRTFTYVVDPFQRSFLITYIIFIGFIIFAHRYL